MAATVTLEKIGLSLKLDNGLTPTGAQKTVTVSLPSINKTAFDADKALAIAQLLSPVLSKTIVKLVENDAKTIGVGQ